MFADAIELMLFSPLIVKILEIRLSKKLKKFKPQIIYIHSTTANIEEFPIVGSSSKQATKLINKTFNKYKSIWSNLTKKFNCIIIQNNYTY